MAGQVARGCPGRAKWRACRVGEAGIGKSALLGVRRGAGARHAGVGRTRRTVRGTHPVRRIIRAVTPALGWLRRDPRLPKWRPCESALALRPAQPQDRFAIGAATLSLLAIYAELAPVVVFVDDAHWLDGSSSDALLFAFRRLLADPVAVVLGVREGEPSLLDGADLQTLRLQGLDRDSTAELLRQRLPGPVSLETAARLQAETGGNPLALVELAAQPWTLDDLAPGAPLPSGSSIAAVYAQRYRALPARDAATCSCWQPRLTAATWRWWHVQPRSWTWTWLT